MANPTSGMGFVPVGHVSGAGSFTGQVNRYYVPSTDATALFLGDPVVITGDFHTDGTPIISVATVGTGVTTDKITGAIVGFEPNVAMPAQKHRLASTAMYVLVNDDPGTIFKCRGDGAYATTDQGSTCQIASGSGNTTTGISGYVLDSSEIAQTATDQLVILGVIDDPTDSDISTALNVVYTVRFNMHTGNLPSAGIS
jgi:hypothetical protein